MLHHTTSQLELVSYSKVLYYTLKSMPSVDGHTARCERVRKSKTAKAKSHRIPKEDEDDGSDPESAHFGESIYLRVR